MVYRSNAVKRDLLLLTALLAGNVTIPSNTWAAEIVNHDITFFCATSTGQVCSPMYSVFFKMDRATRLKAQYTVPPSHCSSIKTTFLLDGKPVYTSGFLGWANAPLPFANLPLNTGLVDLGNVTEGNHVFSIQAEGQLSGCNTGYLEGWDGRVEIISESSPSACSEITNGLVACYPFDGNANDVSGNGFNGTVKGATLTDDRFGNANSAYSFNGVDNVILANNPFASTAIAPMSVSVWINTTSTKQAGGIVTQHTACSGYDDHFHMTLYGSSSNNQLHVDAFDGQRAVVAAPVVADGKWHHVTFVYNQDQQTKLYVDGNLQNSVNAPPVSNFVSTLQVAIGGFVSNSCPQNHNFQGKIDDVRIYNRALSDAEIKQLAGMNQETGLVAHYCFDDANDIGKDCSTNGNNGVAQGTVSQVPGVRGGAAKFGGINAPSSLSVKNSKSLQFNQELSVSTFVKINNAAGMSYYGARVANGVHSLVAKSHDRNGFWFRAALNPSNTFSIEGANNSYASPKTDFAGATTSDDRKDKWVHVAYVISNGVSKLFLDGVLAKTSEASTIDFSIANNQDLYIGKYSDFWYPADASMDDLRLYNRALSDAEIKQLASVTP